MNNLLKTIKDNKKKLEGLDGEYIPVSVFSNITLNLLEPFLVNSYLKKNLKIRIKDFSYSSIILDSQNQTNESISIIHYDSLNLAGEPLDNVANKTEEIKQSLFKKIKEEIEISLTNLSSTKEVYLTTMSYSSFEFVNGQDENIRNHIGEINEHFYHLEKKFSNLKIINLESLLFQSQGLNCINTRELFNSVAPYKFNLLKNLSDDIVNFSSLKNGKVKKVLALDCDNTLWHGTIAEDGQDGIKQDSLSKEGKIFKRIQEDADFLANNGAIICLASKNFEDDVLDFFKSDKTSLKLDNISAYKVNWRSKATNLQEIATELNLGIDSFIFVDDTDHEVNLVRTEAPEVETVKVPEDINDYPHIFSKIRNQFVAQKSKTNKAVQYKQMFERNKEMSTSNNVEDFLKKLDIKLNIFKNKKDQIKRISELSQKTNQFNMTTIRYTENEVEKLMDSELVFCFETSDRFGESGITGASVIRIKNETATIESFLLSCRILGRNIEHEFLNQILSTLKSMQIKTIIANYVETPKNKKFGDFYKKAKFKTDDNKFFQINLESFEIETIKYIEVNHE